MIKRLLFILLVSYTIISYQKIPNVDYMICGYNMKYGDPLNVTISRPIFEDLTYNNNHTVVIDGVDCLMPDQLYVLSYPSEEHKCTSLLYYSVSMVQESLFETFTAGFDCKRISMAFSLSEQVSYFNYMYDEESRYTSNSYLTVTSSKMEINGLMKLNEEFKKTVSMLPVEYNSTTCQHFMTFFDVYGTAFFTKSVYGGYVTMTSSFDTSLTYDKNSYQIGVDLGAQFWMFTGSSGVQWNETQLGEYLSATYESTMTLIGGYPSYYSPSDYQAWSATVPKNPLIVRANVVNITELIFDPETKNAAVYALNDYYNNYSC